VDNQAADRLARVFHIHRPAVAFDDAGVADLAPRFDIEWRQGEDDLDPVAHGSGIDALTITENGEDLGFTAERSVLVLLDAVLNRALFTQRFQDAPVDLARRDAAERAAVAPAADRFVALLGFAEAFLVYDDAELLGDVLRDLERQALFRMEPEGQLARKPDLFHGSQQGVFLCVRQAAAAETAHEGIHDLGGLAIHAGELDHQLVDHVDGAARSLAQTGDHIVERRARQLAAPGQIGQRLAQRL